jgi:ATP-dependent Lhr-like helicase
MTKADRVFSRFPDFIKEYIYSHGWVELREIQLEAARVIFETESNLLLSSSTASGKTEAAFFPIIADLCENQSSEKSVSVLYIAPLKSLINDQFFRLDELLDYSGIPVTHWHGDVGASHKSKLLKNPDGILQITPESLESMVMNRSNDIPRIFGGLRYVVIDEIHAMIGTDR